MPAEQEEGIYLDYNATTPMAPEVSEAMAPFMGEAFGNPSSPYTIGRRTKAALERARGEVAGLFGCKPEEIIFTSGGTESNNAVIKGVVDFRSPGNFHLITTAVEHPAVLGPALFLQGLGARVDFLPVDSRGRVDPEGLRKVLTPETNLISIMTANNETGTLQPIKEISEIAREHAVPVHTDAAQAVGKIPLDVGALGVDFMSVAGHKVYAPKGVGALYIREGRTLVPLLHGAGQEEGRRPGTENVMFAVGLGTACRIAAEGLGEHARHMANTRDDLEARLFEGIGGLVLNGDPEHRLPNTLNVSVPGREGARILDGLPRLMASTGAACHDRSIRLSHVLVAMGVPPDVGMGALRFSTGRNTTLSEIQEAASMVIKRMEEMGHGE